MKINILTVYLFLLQTTFFAQNKSINNSEQPISSKTSHLHQNININTDPVNNKSDVLNPYVFNVRFHILKRTDGSGPTQNIEESEMMNAMKILNTNFNSFSIYFKYNGFDIMTNNDFVKIVDNSNCGTNCPPNTFSNLITTAFYSTPSYYSFTALNIYIVEKIDEDPSTLISTKVGYYDGAGNIAITPNYLLTNILVREAGHYFTLIDVDHQTNPCEKVDGSNALTSGDRVSDTPACPLLTFANFGATCNYISTGARDCTGINGSLGALYVNVPVKNFMINFVNNCNTLNANYEPGNGNFTFGQKMKMRDKIQEYINAPNVVTPIENALTTIASLYQPFSVITLPNGTKQHKFQKGFTYGFYDVVAPNPISANTSITPIISNITADYRVRIFQVNTSLYVNDFQWVYANTPNTLLATNTNNTYSFGKIVSSSQFGVYPFTTQILDNLQVNDPKLKENLKENQYHIITKVNENGEETQEVIYKK